jgi:hypothetical protein
MNALRDKRITYDSFVPAPPVRRCIDRIDTLGLKDADLSLRAFPCRDRNKEAVKFRNEQPVRAPTAVAMH